MTRAVTFITSFLFTLFTTALARSTVFEDQSAAKNLEVPVQTATLENGKRPPVFSLPDSTGRPVSLRSVLGRERLLIAFSPTSSDLEAVRRDRGQFLERDLTLIAISSAKVSSSVAPVLNLRDADGQLAALYGSSGKTLVYLIGKDGTIKRVWERIPKLSDVYALIDAMPMRKGELRR
jgi:peroxiredoxin